MKFKTYIHGGDFRIYSAEISYIKKEDEIQNEETYEVLISLQNTIATNKLNKVLIRIENLYGQYFNCDLEKEEIKDPEP